MSTGFSYKQDLPPKGGYAPIRYKRNIPVRGPAGWVTLSAFTAFTIWAWKGKIQTRLEEHELQRETLWSRIYLVPLLQAEADRELWKQIKENRRRESKVMADVPGWEVDKSVYNDDKYYLSASVRRTPLPPVD